ncbi:MAG: hypothetical protein ACRD96_28570, partial [Bryobacteraceae bacterium]
MTRSPLAFALLAAAICLAWQTATVEANYGGDWTALYCTGELLPTPPALAAENIYRFSGSLGYDGQFYHYIAHDPFFQRGLDRYVDAPRLRYRRILVPALAWLAGAGRFVDPAYFGVVLLFVFAGARWLARCAMEQGRSPAWGLAFLVAPATAVSVDRMTVDVALAALCCAFALNPRSRLVLALAALTRETGFLLAAASAAASLAQRRFRDAAVA